jgi:putative DNA methylase
MPLAKRPPAKKSIRHGHPSTLHLWWARRPLAAARAVIFASLVDDPEAPHAPAPYVEACRALVTPTKTNVNANGDSPRMRLFDFIEQLVQWESTNDETVLNTARDLIQLSTEYAPRSARPVRRREHPARGATTGARGARQRLEPRRRDD